MKSFANQVEPESNSDKSVSLLKTLKLLWPYFGKYKARIIWAFCFLILAKLATIAVPVLLKYIVDYLDINTSNPSVLLVPLGLILGYGALRLSSVIFNEIKSLLFAPVSQEAIRLVTLGIFNHLHQLSLRFHLVRQTGGLTRDIERGSKSIELFLRYMLFNILPTLFEIVVVCLIFLSGYGLTISAITIVTIICYVFFTVKVTNWRTKYRWQMNKQDSAASTTAVEALINYETVKYFNNEQFESERYDASLKRWQTASLKSFYSLSFLNIGQGVIIVIALTLVLSIAAKQVANNTITLGDFVLINTLLLQLYIPLGFLGSVFREIQRCLIDLNKLFSLFDEKVEIVDSKNAKPLQQPLADIQFSDIEFSYDSNRPILKGLSFIAKSKEKTAIVGASGAGKSTLSRLLFRFYNVNNGHIQIGEQRLSDIQLNSLRQNIGIVPQDTVLFNDSIAFNIAYGKVGANMDEVKRVAKMAYLNEFIESLPDGYDTVVGERGLKLSGGEKQRIAIARTLLKNPSILVLDEATSSLDTKSEQSIQQALLEISKERTTLVIAHRLSTIVDSDNIIVMDKGLIVESGNHNELLEKNGVYTELWNLQLNHSEEQED